MDQENIDVTTMAGNAESLRKKGASVMYLAVDGQLAGLLAVSDPIKKSTPEAVKDLKAAGIRVLMATGVRVSTAKDVAQHLGIDAIQGEEKPANTDARTGRATGGERGGE